MLYAHFMESYLFIYLFFLVGEGPPSASRSERLQREVSPSSSTSLPSPFLTPSSQQALMEEAFSPPRYATLQKDVDCRAFPPSQYGMQSAPNGPSPASLSASSTSSSDGFKASLPREDAYDGEGSCFRSGEAPPPHRTGSHTMYDVGDLPVPDRDERQVAERPKWLPVDPVPIVSDAIIDPIKVPWGTNAIPSAPLPPSLSAPSSAASPPLSYSIPTKLGEGERTRSGMSLGLPAARKATVGSATTPSAYPMASRIPPPEELVTIGVTLEEYRQQMAEAAAEAEAARNRAALLFAPHWLTSATDCCSDFALLADAIIFPCCLVAAGAQAFLRPDRVQNPMTCNCHRPTAIGLTLCSFLNGTFCGTLSLELWGDACCCPGCCCVVPVVSAVAFMVRFSIRRRYHIRGCRASSTYVFLSSPSSSSSQGNGEPSIGQGSECQPLDLNTNTIHGVHPSSSVSTLQKVGEVCGDAWCSVCCVWCVLMQNHRELVYRKGYHGKVVFSRSLAMPTYEIQ